MDNEMNIEEIQKIYDGIALDALNTIQIEREGDSFDLVEIEVYLLDPTQKIKDVFIHEHEDQLEKDEIYYHYSGVDICRGGGKGSGVYCGILVRGISNENKTIYGPGRIAYRRTPKKEKITIEPKPKSKKDNCVFVEDASINEDIKNIVLKLPRVNLGHSTIMKKEKEEVYKYLNLKARYLRLINGEISSCKNKSPMETREVFNALYEYEDKK